MTKINIYFLLIFLICIKSISYASPERMVSVKEALVGYTDSHYYTYLSIRDYPSSYYRYYHYLYLCKYDLANKKLEESTLIQKISYRDTTTLRDWQRDVSTNETLNIDNYFIENNISYAFPLLESNELRVEKNNNKLVLIDNYIDANRIIIDSTQLDKYEEVNFNSPLWQEYEGLGVFIEPSEVIMWYKNKTHYFFVFKSDTPVITIKISDIEKARDSLIQRRKQFSTLYHIDCNYLIFD